MIERLLCLGCLILGYFFGTIQTAFIIGKILNIDVRKNGSGNLGTTNVMRVIGVRSGLLTFLGDCVKVVIPILAAYGLFLWNNPLNVDISRYAICLYTGLGAVLGHDFPFYLHFKGGKGVATTAMVIIMLGDWRLTLFGVLIFFAVAVITRYVSLGSLVLMLAECVLSTVFMSNNIIEVSGSWIYDCVIILIILTLLIFIQHRSNISRLIHGEERKFSVKHRNKDAENTENATEDKQ